MDDPESSSCPFGRVPCGESDDSAGEAPVLRVGIFSDTQSYPGKTTDRGQIAMRRVLDQLKGQGIDVLVYAGDISDNGNQLVYKEYRETFREVFGDDGPEEFAIMGNHDYWNGMEPSDAQRNFMEGMGLDAINKSKVVRGYSFIAVSPDSSDCTDGAFGESDQAFVKAEVEAALARDPEKPVFVITHQHARGTVYGSEGWGVQAITDTLAPYGNVVHFSGHSHFPVQDERSIHQKDFTAIGTSTLAYCELEKGRVYGPVPPRAGDCHEYLVMEVFADRLVIKRFREDSGAEIKPGRRWTVPLPLKRETFRYTDKRAATRVAPCFPAGAKGAVSFPEEAEVEKTFLLSFDAARHDDFVETYVVRCKGARPDGSWEEIWENLYYADYYRGPAKMEDPFRIWIAKEGLEPGRAYRFEIVPMESFGKTGTEPLVVDFRMAGD